MPSSDRIEINPRIHHGQPVIKGTRVPVTRILAEVAAGTSFERIQQQYDVAPEDTSGYDALASGRRRAVGRGAGGSMLRTPGEKLVRILGTNQS